MCKICPKCKSIAEYNAYYGRVTCTHCSWESDNSSNKCTTKIKIKSCTTKKGYEKKLVKA